MTKRNRKNKNVAAEQNVDVAEQINQNATDTGEALAQAFLGGAEQVVADTDAEMSQPGYVPQFELDEAAAQAEADADEAGQAHEPVADEDGIAPEDEAAIAEQTEALDSGDATGELPETAPAEDVQVETETAEQKSLREQIEEAAAARKAKSGGGTGKKGPAPAYGDDEKITVLVGSNPKKHGTPSYRRFLAYYGVSTVGEAIAKGVLRADLRWDVNHGFIQIGDAPTAAESAEGDDGADATGDDGADATANEGSDVSAENGADADAGNEEGTVAE